MDEYEQICETTKQLTDLKEHEELIYANAKLKSLKQDITFAGILGTPMAILFLGSLVATIRNPAAINLICTLSCLSSAGLIASFGYRDAKKYIQLKKNLQNQYQ